MPILAAILLSATAAWAETNNKPAADLSYTPQDRLIAKAIAALEKAGLGPKYNLLRPFYVRTQSQMGEDFVAFATGQHPPDDEGFIRVRCIVRVDSLRGTAGEHEELQEDGRQILVRLDRHGTVIGFRINEPQPAASPYVSPEAVEPSGEP